jgi:hypothetical protein
MRRVSRPLVPAGTGKRPGLCYAVTDDGLELPVIDVTHPAFRLDIDPPALQALTEKAILDMDRQERIPRLLQRLFLRTYLRGSRLGGAIARSRNTYLDAMSTYIIKLGPDNLGAAASAPVDRLIAASLPCLCARLRLQQVAALLAEGLMPMLEASPRGALTLLTIAGGAASDSLNTLLILHRDAPDLLSGRKIRIEVLDRDGAGPAFAGRALAALRADGAPLAGVDLTLEHRLYDWSNPEPLEKRVELCSAGGGIVAGVSEGGLFDYASDGEVTGNLAPFAAGDPDRTLFAGTVGRVDGFRRRFTASGGAALRLRDFDAVAGLCEHAGFRITRQKESPLSYSFRLGRA